MASNTTTLDEALGLVDESITATRRLVDELLQQIDDLHRIKKRISAERRDAAEWVRVPVGDLRLGDRILWCGREGTVLRLGTTSLDARIVGVGYGDDPEIIEGAFARHQCFYVCPSRPPEDTPSDYEALIDCEGAF